MFSLHPHVFVEAIKQKLEKVAVLSSLLRAVFMLSCADERGALASQILTCSSVRLLGVMSKAPFAIKVIGIVVLAGATIECPGMRETRGREIRQCGDASDKTLVTY